MGENVQPITPSEATSVRKERYLDEVEDFIYRTNLYIEDHFYPGSVLGIPDRELGRHDSVRAIVAERFRKAGWSVTKAENWSGHEFGLQG